MFIYLDHAQISALDVLQQRDPKGFGEFLAFWLDHGCQLVLSRAHLHEIGQSDDERDVIRRLKLLRYFSVWSGAGDENVDWVIIREIRHQTLHRLRTGTQATPDTYAGVREELYRPTEHGAIEDFVHRSRPGWLDEQRLRRDLAAFENRSRRVQQAYRKLSKRKEPKWDPEGWKMLPVARTFLPDLRGDAVAERWLREVEGRTRECWSRAKRKRQMLVCIYDIEDLACVARAPERDLSRIGFYQALANHWVAPYCRRAGHDPETVGAALKEMDPYDAPAISAALAVERGRKSQEKAYEPGDFTDVDHVLWAAYADLAFVDRRTHGFLLQARKNRDTARLLSPHLCVQYERAASLEDVQRHIASLDVGAS